VQTYADAPLTLVYEGLDPAAHYAVRLVYSYQGWGERPVSRLYAYAYQRGSGARGGGGPLALGTGAEAQAAQAAQAAAAAGAGAGAAGAGAGTQVPVLLHDYLPAPVPTRPLEFAIPPHATAQGAVAVECRQPPGSAQAGNSGRGCLISEVWLLRTDPDPDPDPAVDPA
jgi:hypothetical protein